MISECGMGEKWRQPKGVSALLDSTLLRLMSQVSIIKVLKHPFTSLKKMVAEPASAETAAALGVPIPYLNPHALSVSLPTWDSNVRWASGDPLIIQAMSTGYPRFFIHRTIQKVGSVMPIPCLRWPNSIAFLARLLLSRENRNPKRTLHAFPYCPHGQCLLFVHVELYRSRRRPHGHQSSRSDPPRS